MELAINYPKMTHTSIMTRQIGIFQEFSIHYTGGSMLIHIKRAKTVNVVMMGHAPHTITSNIEKVEKPLMATL